jgi:hypothetical protein
MSNSTFLMEEEKEQSLYFEFLRYLLPIFSLFLIIYGTLTNLFSSILCFSLVKKKPLSAFIILGLMFLVCPFNLYTWNLDVFLNLFYKIRQKESITLSQFYIIESRSITTCRIFFFIQQFGLHSTAWLFSLLLIDQVTKLYLSHMNCHKKINFMTITSVVIIIIAFGSNFIILLFAGKQKFDEEELLKMNITGNYAKFICYESDVFNTSLFSDILTDLVAELIPLGVIGFCSILIFLKLRIKSSLADSIEARSLRRRKRYSISFLIMSTIYLISIVPAMICFSYYFDEIISWNNGDQFLSFLNVLHFTFFGMLPTIFFFTNRAFKKEISNLFPRLNCWKTDSDRSTS